MEGSENSANLDWRKRLDEFQSEAGAAVVKGISTLRGLAKIQNNDSTVSKTSQTTQSTFVIHFQNVGHFLMSLFKNVFCLEFLWNL
jgi:hypothetical protein